ncbi:hypothetical protein FOVG_19539 [Fusarium oxysporum f. sp. pisi HDV247]|uniref:Uncharacterized protein n=1 Tax=Fusarium oxysporum f. sp. pisi HDV247 TaxID=1080344 RepID=W9N8F1_FUSOX|nr:hypothetical protein FOVG_19539 [Fusarium oxysporum f. sp. pisi HDV247]
MPSSAALGQVETPAEGSTASPATMKPPTLGSTTRDPRCFTYHPWMRSAMDSSGAYSMAQARLAKTVIIV